MVDYWSTPSYLGEKLMALAARYLRMTVRPIVFIFRPSPAFSDKETTEGDARDN
jgi:hypothetical protein